MEKEEVILSKYLDYLKYERAYSNYTVLSYQNDILEYLDYVKGEALNFLKVEYGDLRFYLMYLKDTKKDIT